MVVKKKKDTLLDATGHPIKKIEVPVVMYKDYKFAVDLVKPEEMVQVSEKGVKPVDIITEMRALKRETQHRFTLLAAALATACSEDGLKALKEFLDSIGLKIVDASGKVFYEPEKKD